MAFTNDVMDAVNIVGGVQAVARKLGVPETFVKEWIAKGTMESATHEHVVVALVRNITRAPGAA